MVDTLNHLHGQLVHWAGDAAAQGWLDKHAIQALDQATLATPGGLFDTPERPLVVGLFGGTGVGKSTLLNRLAAEPIARTSAERPTSRNVTAYIHRSVTVDHLPDDFPMQRMRTSIHQNDAYRSVLWIDMPDFDSVEASHSELVQHWLPHIDVVIYVVSPERYRDDHGWRLLLEHGAEHAWLFVINHWDRGDVRQRDDFRELLSQAGLADPMIFCTDSRPAEAVPAAAANSAADDFAALEQTIQSLANQQLVEQLESRGVLQRWRQLQGIGTSLLEQMGSPQQTRELAEKWPAWWQKTAEQLHASGDWKVPLLAASHAERESSLWSRLFNRQRDDSAASDNSNGQAAIAANDSGNSNLPAIIDNSFIDRVMEAVDTYVQQSALPLRALEAHVKPLQESLPPKLSTTVQDALHQSMALPGNRWQRGLHRLLGWLATLLPLAAMGWIGFRVVNGFRLGGAEPSSYLGSNFAVHSALLLALAWGLPAFLRYRARPSREQAARRGLRTGMQNALTQVEQEVRRQLEAAATGQQAIQHNFEALWTDSATFDDNHLPEPVRRMLTAPGHAQGSAAVRAITHSSTSAAPVS